MVILHQQAGRAGAIAQAELRAEVRPQRHEMMENTRIADHPGRQEREKDHSAQGGTGQGTWQAGVRPVRIQTPAKGRKSTRAGLASAIAPQMSPKSTQSRIANRPGRSGDRWCIRRASAKAQVKSRVLRLVSHTQRTAYCIAAG